MRSLRFVFLLMLIIAFTVVSAQTVACPVIVEQALALADQMCQDLGRNQACYGNIQLDAQPQPDITDFQFERVGDIVELNAIDSMRLSPLDETKGHWGVAIMRVQGDIPDTLPGQNVTFILFGDVMLQSAIQSGQNPMQAFYLQTGVGDAGCVEAPESGLLIQTPDGVSEVTFNINGADVRIGSTVLMQAERGDEMRLTTVEGAALVDIAGEWFPAVQGTRLRMAIGDDLLPLNFPWFPEQYQIDTLQQLPTDLLQRQISVAAPLTNRGYDDLLDLLITESAPCGRDELPDCEKFDDIDDWADLRKWGQPLQPGISCAAIESDPDYLPPCSGIGRGYVDRDDDSDDDRDDDFDDDRDDDSDDDRDDDSDDDRDDDRDDDSDDDRDDDSDDNSDDSGGDDSPDDSSSGGDSGSSGSSGGDSGSSGSSGGDSGSSGSSGGDSGSSGSSGGDSGSSGSSGGDSGSSGSSGGDSGSSDDDASDDSGDDD